MEHLQAKYSAIEERAVGDEDDEEEGAPANAPSADGPAAAVPEEEGQEFYFVTAKALLESAHFDRILKGKCTCRTEGSPCKCCALGKFQQIRTADPDAIVSEYVSLVDACSGELRKDVLVVSHRWLSPEAPDAGGTQLATIRAHLMAHDEIRLVWYDAWCMPQDERTAKEKEEKAKDTRTEEDVKDFKRMLADVNLLYVGASVLFLLDVSYISRFWTQFEAWLSMQKATWRVYGR